MNPTPDPREGLVPAALVTVCGLLALGGILFWLLFAPSSADCASCPTTCAGGDCGWKCTCVVEPGEYWGRCVYTGR